jgi:hypothetical protein
MIGMDTDNEKEMRNKVAALALSDDATRRRVICGLIGHSRIVDDAGDGPGWRVTCARCGDLVDGTDQIFDACGAVFRRHVEESDCESCKENIKNMTWRDTWEVALGQTDGRC